MLNIEFGDLLLKKMLVEHANDCLMAIEGIGEFEFNYSNSLKTAA